MIPTSSNIADQGCSPVSSNCVVWQGPDLSCINLCKGDTVSDVVYKLATEVCNITTDLGLSDLDLSALVQVCSVTPEPAKTLAAVLDLLINKVVCLADIVDNLPGGGNNYTEPTLNLPVCLQYINAQGQTITSLEHSQYSLTLATKICQMNSSINTQTTQISGLNTRVTALENQTADALPQVAMTCLTGNSTLLDLDNALGVVATELCAVKDVVGSNTAITAAAAKQCAGLGNLPALSQTGTMSTIPGWKSSVSTLSDSFFNLWLTVCDIRGAIADIKSNLSTVDCSAIIIDYVATANTNRDAITLNFNGLCTIPATFSECNQLGSKVTITDTAGKSFVAYVQVVANKTNSNGVTISLSGSGLGTTLNYTVKLEACVTKDGQTCTKEVTKTLYAACTTITINSATIS